MIFKNALIKTILKMVLPEVTKLIKPLKKYVDEPNELDDLCRGLKQKADATHDILIDVGKTANAVEEDFNKFKEQSEKTVKVVLGKVKDLEDIGSRLITLQAMVDKFDRDQDYLDQKVKDIGSIINTITTFKGEK
tara:strand:- start:15 stop:419 length:405 start_codon:yes stop_codon:yes gene_type:complete